MKITYWTKVEFDLEVATLFNDMKQHGWSKTDAAQDVRRTMQENNIKIKTK